MVQCWSFASNRGYRSRLSTPRESNKGGLNLVGCRRRSGRLLTHKLVIKIPVAGYGRRIACSLKLGDLEGFKKGKSTDWPERYGSIGRGASVQLKSGQSPNFQHLPI